MVKPYVRPGAAVLDVGCHDGALFRTLSGRLSRGVGIDPMLALSETQGRFRFIAGAFPANLDGGERFDVLTLLAILEHIEPEELLRWREACERLIVPGGFVVATVPSPLVDTMLEVLTRFRLVAGMSIEEHHGFDPSNVPSLFADRSMELTVRRRFELGMNNLFVFRRSDA
jgi:2-polyprenyl-3-methyl-5-hydroxy-6-metoxy-1,4-benzoquinol methylase